MKMEVNRFMCGAVCTIGELLVDGEHECWTLEDVMRPGGEKVPGETAIPDGTYKVIVNHSNRFGCDMPLLLEVPGFTGIRIHSGNLATQTEGCLLVGTGHTADSVTNSRLAFNTLFPKIRDAFRRGEEITITYKSGGV
ncbi:MAG: hypothetical protein CGW95_17050 [Phenylobacterium zucineum]|nr:MAG: hypothetical protein CGW95_17050 [Phenylobacterium zucineum]